MDPPRASFHLRCFTLHLLLRRRVANCRAAEGFYRRIMTQVASSWRSLSRRQTMRLIWSQRRLHQKRREQQHLRMRLAVAEPARALVWARARTGVRTRMYRCSSRKQGSYVQEEPPRRTLTFRAASKP